MTTPVRVLLVDDIEENLIALEALVRRLGVEVSVASSGREALELLLVHDYALALLDVNMPEMDGFQLAELMRGSQRTRNVPIIFVTAAYEPARVFQGYDAGAIDFLSKPVDPQVLRHKVKTFIELYESRRQLAESLRMHETFVAALNHDLRTPLSTIAMGIELLSDVELPRHKEVLRRLGSAAERMTGMLDQLYDVARIRIGTGLQLEPRRGDLREVVERVFQEAELRRGTKTLSLHVEGDSTGSWDLPRVSRIAANLIYNALAHGAGGAVQVSIDGTDVHTVRLSVANAGAIPGDLLPVIFEPFRRGAGSRNGLGLGLFIVQELTKAHRGEVSVTSTPETGTRFEVRLPRVVSGGPAVVPGAM